MDAVTIRISVSSFAQVRWCINTSSGFTMFIVVLICLESVGGFSKNPTPTSRSHTKGEFTWRNSREIERKIIRDSVVSVLLESKSVNIAVANVNGRSVFF